MNTDTREALARELIRLADILRDCGRLVSKSGSAEKIMRDAAAALATQPAQPSAVMNQAADLLAHSMMLADADRVRSGALVVEAHNLLVGTHAEAQPIPLHLSREPDAGLEDGSVKPAQPSDCKAGGACRWRGTASAELVAQHQAAQPSAQPLLVRDVAEMLGIDSSVPICKALVAMGYPPRSVNMAVTPDEAVAVAKHLAAQPSAQGEPSKCRVCGEGRVDVFGRCQSCGIASSQAVPHPKPSAQGEAVADERFYSALAAMTRVLDANVREGIKNYVIQTGRNDWNRTRASAPAAPAQPAVRWLCNRCGHDSSCAGEDAVVNRCSSCEATGTMQPLAASPQPAPSAQAIPCARCATPEPCKERGCFAAERDAERFGAAQPMEPGRLEYEAELCTRNPAPHAEPPLVGTPSRTLQIGPGSTLLQRQMDRQLETDQLVQAAVTKPSAVVKGYYDFVTEGPRTRVELTPEGRDLCAGTTLWPHEAPPQPKPLPKLPKVPKDMCFGSGVINGQRVELRGWTTEMMQPWIDAVLAAFKESVR